MESMGLLFKVLWSPAEAFFILSKKPRVLAPLIVITLASLAASIVTFTYIDMGELTLRQIEQSPSGANMPEEQKQQMVQMIRTFTPVSMVIGAVAPAVIVTIAALIYFAVFMVIGRDSDFKTFLSITAFAHLPLIVRQAAAIAQVYLTPAAQLDIYNLGGLGLATFLDPGAVSPTVYAASTVVDIVSIWVWILLIIGYKFVVPKSVGIAARASGVLVVSLFFSLIFAALRLLQQPG